eukprot:6415711-Prymnesium_polylepis.1
MARCSISPPRRSRGLRRTRTCGEVVCARPRGLEPQCTARTVDTHAAIEQRSDAQHPGRALRSHVARSAASGRVPHS